jgi:hypothetical protein
MICSYIAGRMKCSAPATMNRMPVTAARTR